MLDIKASLEGDKVIIDGLENLAEHLTDTIQRGLSKIAGGVYDRAFAFLSGPGAKGTSEYRVSKKTGKKYLKYTKRDTPIAAGQYPVPVRTGFLQSALDFLEPGETKNAFGETFTAGPLEAIVFDAAEYAKTIHEGLGSSAKYGPRQFITDAFEKFNQGERAAQTLDEEIAEEIKKQRLGD